MSVKVAVGVGFPAVQQFDTPTLISPKDGAPVIDLDRAGTCVLIMLPVELVNVEKIHVICLVYVVPRSITRL